MDDSGQNKRNMIVKSVSCDVCKKVFKTKTYLKVHKRIHTEETPYKCDFCDKSFIVKGSLTKHMLVHSGKKDFQCHVCHKKFSQKCI